MPAGQVTINCHYITKSLTKPWEREGRRLRFYDFSTRRFCNGFAASLFAASHLNTQAVETWLDQTIEAPLNICRRQYLQAGRMDALEEWNFYRAASLMLWLQGIRVRAVADHDARRDLETLALRPMNEVDQLVMAIRAEFDLTLITTVKVADRWAPLFFPSSGTFPITYPDAGCVSGHAIALGLPLDWWCALVAIPKERPQGRDLSRLPSSIANLSIGVADATKVLLHSSLDGVPESEILAALDAQRILNTSVLGLVGEIRDLVLGGFSEAGIQPGRDAAGRVVPQ